MARRGPLGSNTGVHRSYVLRKLASTLAVLSVPFAQDFSHMRRDMASVTATMNPLVAEDTNFKRGLAGAIGSYFGRGSFF